MNRIFRLLRQWLHRYFNLDDDKAESEEIITAITKGIYFKGVNLWTLVFAIFIASIGLNVNATAVIIGAMLISPLMGPIMGVGLGIGINDFELVKKGAYNLLVATIISILTSTIYFSVTPLHEANSELLARTTPTIWDVFIAFVGGLAGIVAGTRKEKTNVIPGVAIATALMPPLCTAGFGLANGNWYYFLGALYLFSINSVFICFATILIVRYLHFPKKSFQDPAREKKVARYIWIVVIITIIPSIYLAYRIVNRSIFMANANNFLKNEFNFKNTQVVNKTFAYNGKNNRIELLLIGEELENTTIDTLSAHMKNYHLGQCELVVKQGLNAKQEIDFSQIKASILEDVFRQQAITTPAVTKTPAHDTAITNTLTSELKTLFPSITAYSISNNAFVRIADNNRDTATYFVARTKRPLNRQDKNKLQQWLQARLSKDTLLLSMEIVR
ncbi:TIGR00341 family protein [Chitinophaga pendula]|uniref:TIGR00341 family protein n=1 Tax=Chitinophaga pendula TaxID=2849666 RepID=UPI000BAE8927|nr:MULTISPECIES: TIGR00341 family protein [Chitinophaga]ASZ12767.1 TIGR00341 family protein [Chitinophaga sp. MD30]UCJ09613.1 TIGR00341 family protein [Chitinophaga pendula]